MEQTTVVDKKTVQIPSPQKEKKMGEKFSQGHPTRI